MTGAAEDSFIHPNYPQLVVIPEEETKAIFFY